MIDKNHEPVVGIMGAGIMGCCLALELAQRGHKVDLIDLAKIPMTGASLHNEGKLHLGFVYAKDPLKETHGLMIKGSLSFSRIIEKLTGHGVDDFKPSKPFQYFVPNDSQLDMTAIKNHFEDVERTIHEVINNTGDLYLKSKAERYSMQNSSAYHESMFSPHSTLGSFSTEEKSVSTVAVAKILRAAIERHPKINFIGNTEVKTVNRLSSSEVEIETIRSGVVSLKRYPSVVNCLWDDKLRVDSTAGIIDQGSWVLRYKATVNISVSSIDHNMIPSATGILGSYGDVVNHNNGSYYISWYPLSKLAQSLNKDGRMLHNKIHKKFMPNFMKKFISNYPSIYDLITSKTHKGFIKNNIQEMTTYIPAMKNLLNGKVTGNIGGGVIIARGNSDIDDPDSYLHQRSAIGPIAYGSYVTIDTGKYCTAPLFAVEAADMITGVL